MDAKNFDAFTRFVTERPSRRGVLHALAGGGVAAMVGRRLGLTDIDAKNKGGKKRKKKKTKSPPSATCTPKCGRKQCGDDGCGGSCGNCAAGQHCTSGTCCTPEPPAVTCAGRCGTVTSVKTCRQPVACTCPSGQECLGNGSCATVCGPGAVLCPASSCGNCAVSVEGANHCYTWNYCEGEACTSTAECPVGHHCQPTGCGPFGKPENQCLPLCNG